MRFLPLAIVATALAPAQQEGPDRILSSVVVTDSSAYIVGPSKLLMDGEVIDLEFVRDGRYAIVYGRKRPENPLAFKGQDPLRKPEPEWVKFWDTSSGAIKAVAPSAAKLLLYRSALGQVEWTARPSLAVMAVSEAPQDLKGNIHTTLLLVDVLSGSVSKVGANSNEGPGDEVFASPVNASFVTLDTQLNKPIDPRDRKTTFRYCVYDLSGRETKRGTATVKGRGSFLDWTRDGANLVGTVTHQGAPGTPASAATIVLNLLTGTVSETSEKIASYHDEPDEAAELDLQTVQTEVKVGQSHRQVRSLWLATPKPSSHQRCYVAADVSGQGWLSPRLDRLAYTVDGRLFSCEIVKLDLAAYAKMRDQAERTWAMHKARIVGLGISIYSADYDDALPLKDGFNDSLQPYLKDNDILEGFVYLGNGGSVKGDPTKTELGYVPVKGGRCVVYGDGHVGFVGNP